MVDSSQVYVGSQEYRRAMAQVGLCPYCGNRPRGLECMNGLRGYTPGVSPVRWMRVECDVCHCCGPYKRDALSAVLSWNSLNGGK